MVAADAKPPNIYTARFFRQRPGPSCRFLKISVTRLLQGLNCYEKFFLPCRILEARSYNVSIKAGDFRPFEAPEVVICSYQFARGKAAEVANTPWDVVVIDEAHRLRNVYKPGNVIANTLKVALGRVPKLLLTATPLQNSLLELYGLVSFIDEHTFGDLKSFREQFASLSQQQVFETLKARLKPVCHRTLRRQVTSYTDNFGYEPM